GMKAHREEPKRWSAVGAREETRKLLRRIRKDGALSIRDIEEELIEKAHQVCPYSNATRNNIDVKLSLA
ncbi:MAG: hypothetical protein ACK40A_17900, partial [Pannonibacter indicus]